jgi:hypothetical protein
MSSYLITNDEVIVVIKGRPFQADKTHPNYDRIIGAIKDKNWDDVPTLMDRAHAINANGNGKITVVNGEVIWNGNVLRNSVTERILTMIDEGFNVDPMVAFLENLMKNPSQDSINELYGFLEKCKLPITEDGCFVAYKRVGGNWNDLHSNTVPNKPAALMTDEERATYPKIVGKVTIRIVDGMTELSMPREAVDSNRHRTCSDGLHFCSLDYLGEFYGGSGHIVLVKINPADVVSIPADYNDTKGRTSRYTVLSEIVTDNGNLQKDVFNQTVVSAGATTNSYEYIEGYVFGYDQGKDKAEKFPPSVDQTARYAGYLDGYKDGRGHNKRKYTKSDLKS